ncbi:MAG: CAP domain-containing protein [Protaetiibacter sp.]
MGDESTEVLDVAVEHEVVPEPAGDEGVARRRIPRRAWVAIAAVGALVIAGGVAGGVAWANRVAHDEAVAEAQAARLVTVDAVRAQRGAVATLASSVTGGVAVRDAVASQVLAHQDLLGGAEALASLTAAHAELASVLADVVGVDEPGPDSVVPDAVPIELPDAVDPTAETELLRALALALGEDADAAEASRVELLARAERIDTASAALNAGLGETAASIAAVHEALLASHALASEETRAAAADATAALDGADAAELPGLLAAYASSASAVISAHDAEAARIAAEQAAAAEAARRARSGGGAGGGGGGGGSVTGASEQRGVLSETNANRSANGLGGLSWNGTLASRSCSFAAELASRNGDLYHSSFGGGFSTWGENVAYGYGSASAVVAGWMNSSGHRANILNGAFTMMGACSSTSSTGRVYWVQQFGG